MIYKPLENDVIPTACKYRIQIIVIICIRYLHAVYRMVGDCARPEDDVH